MGVIVIIGGTTGLGLSAAKALCQAGHSVCIVGRREESLASALAQLPRDQACGLAGDAIDSATSEQAIARATEQFGPLTGLYHVAGGSGRSKGDGPLHEMTDEGLEATLQHNLASLMKSNRAAVRQFLAQQTGGAILNMGSVLGWSPSPTFFASHAYAAAKSGIVGFTKAIAAYYAKDDIRANVIAPALVETPMSGRASRDGTIQQFIHTKQPLDGGRNGQPQDLDGAVCLLLSQASRFITGQVLAVDGGWTVSEGQVPNL